MTDFFIRNIPTPLPRPIMEETIHGAANPGIRLDIPMPEMADIDLTYPLLGLDWVTYPWTYTKGLFMELLSYTNIYDFAANAEDFFYFLLVTSTLAAVVVLGSMLVGWVWKKLC